MRILALDTSTNACSAAFSDGRDVIEKFDIVPRQHTQLILPMLDEVLHEAEVKREQLDAIAFVAGPGSFTGIRIATSIAQGLSLGLDIPVIPLSSLLLLAVDAWQNNIATEIVPCIDARRDQVYWAHYRFQDFPLNTELNEEPSVVVCDRLTAAAEMFDACPENGVLYGSGKNADEDPTEIVYPRASAGLKIAALRLKNGVVSQPGEAQAIYFRKGL